MDWIHDELRDGFDNYEATKLQPYKSNRFDIMDDIAKSKNKV